MEVYLKSAINNRKLSKSFHTNLNNIYIHIEEINTTFQLNQISLVDSHNFKYV